MAEYENDFYLTPYTKNQPQVYCRSNTEGKSIKLIYNTGKFLNDFRVGEVCKKPQPYTKG